MKSQFNLRYFCGMTSKMHHWVCAKPLPADVICHCLLSTQSEIFATNLILWQKETKVDETIRGQEGHQESLWQEEGSFKFVSNSQSRLFSGAAVIKMFCASIRTTNLSRLHTQSVPESQTQQSALNVQNKSIWSDPILWMIQYTTVRSFGLWKLDHLSRSGPVKGL